MRLSSVWLDESLAARSPGCSAVIDTGGSGRSWLLAGAAMGRGSYGWRQLRQGQFRAGAEGIQGAGGLYVTSGLSRVGAGL